MALCGLLFTVVILFALQGEAITSQPFDVARIALPLLIYFGVMWAVSFAMRLWLRLSYEKNTTVAFLAASNSLDFAIAVFRATSGEALAGVVGPLIEVPVLVGLVYVALWARRRLYPERKEELVLTVTTAVATAVTHLRLPPVTTVKQVSAPIM